MAQLIELIKSIPAQVVNEGAAYGPLKLTDFIQSRKGPIKFSAGLSSGVSLPKGLICTTDGIINGIPAAGTQGAYKVAVTADTEEGGHLVVEFDLAIKPRMEIADHHLLTQLKAQIWEAIGNNLPPPDMMELLNRPITAVEMYYLLERFASLTIWDVYNFESPGEKILLTLEGASPHYNVYDRGSCLVGAPKDLFSHERTLEDALQTSRAMAREVYKRGWVIEFMGFNKMNRAAWVELQHLGEKNGKYLEILRYQPSLSDIQTYSVQNKMRDFGL